jgi:hypothetical protein
MHQYSPAQAHPGGSAAMRSVVAVIVGILANVVLAAASDLMMHAAGAFPADRPAEAVWPWLVALCYRCLYAGVGGYLTARLAPARPMSHVGVLLGVGVAAGMVGAIVFWNTAHEMGPRWYMAGVIPVSVVGTLAGGVTGARRGIR